MTLKIKLQHIHENLLLIKQIQTDYPELRDKLADVWNLLLDHRTLIVEKELPDDVLDTLSLRHDLILALAKDNNVSFDKNETIIRIRNTQRVES